jgi:propanol-preferring alcohol dehydrogenase
MLYGLLAEKQMHAMVLSARGAPIQMQERADPDPGDGQIRVKVSACAAVLKPQVR